MSRINTVGSLIHGSLVVGGTALQLTATSRALTRGVRIKADAGNGANFIFVGGSAVTAGIAAAGTDGYKLAAGQEVFVEIDDINKVYVIASASTQAVSWIAS